MAVVIDNNDVETLELLSSLGLSEEQLYDTSDIDGDYNDKLKDGLSERQIEMAAKFKRFRRGVFLVTGKPGGGKDLTAIAIAYYLKTLFKGVKILMDVPPKKSFGLYVPFNYNILKAQMKRLAIVREQEEKEREEVDGETGEILESSDKISFNDATLADRFAEKYLRNSILVITELKKWAYNRESTSQKNKWLGQIITRWRHYDFSVIGCTPYENEIDEKAFLQYVTGKVFCKWLPSEVTQCDMWLTRYVADRGILNVTKRIKPFTIDGKAELPELGNKYENGRLIGYNRLYDLYNTKS